MAFDQHYYDARFLDQNFNGIEITGILFFFTLSVLHKIIYPYKTKTESPGTLALKVNPSKFLLFLELFSIFPMFCIYLPLSE